jgi:hypothetical protein
MLYSFCTRQLTLYFCKWRSFHCSFWIIELAPVRIQYETPGLNFYDSILVGYHVLCLSTCLPIFRREVCNHQNPRIHIRENLKNSNSWTWARCKRILYNKNIIYINNIHFEFKINMSIIKHVNTDQNAESFSNNENIITICAVIYIIPIYYSIKIYVTSQLV